MAIYETAQPTKGSAALTAAYLVICVALLISLINGSVGAIFMGLRPGYNEIYTFIVIAFLGTICAVIGKDNQSSVMSIGTVAAFIALTFNQEPLVRYLSLGAVLFSLGMYGMVSARNAVRVLMSIELMLNAVNINMVAFARYVDPVHIRGQIFAIFILTVAAAEAAVGLAIVLAIYRNTATVDMDRFNLLKW
jgi:NAD(P)H-quinone oxidoreductase subunit 4L